MKIFILDITNKMKLFQFILNRIDCILIFILDNCINSYIK
jgi:hypothetical protein